MKQSWRVLGYKIKKFGHWNFLTYVQGLHKKVFSSNYCSREYKYYILHDLNLLLKDFELKKMLKICRSRYLKVVCTSTNRENCVCSSKIFFLTFEIFNALSSHMERFLLQ